MTKKSKSRSKVTTNTSASVIDSKEDNVAAASNVLLENPAKSGTYSHPVNSNSTTTSTKNGQIASVNNSSSNSNNKPKQISLGHIPSSTTPSLATIPGIVDDFLAPKFVKVLNFSDHGYEKTPPPSLADYKKSKVNHKVSTDNNANKVDNSNGDKEKELSSTNPQQQPVKKNKRKKSKPIKNAGANIGTCYDSEDDGRELDVLNSTGSSYNGNGSHHYPSDYFHHPSSGLTSKEASNLTQLQRIRNSAFRYEGNNIVIVSNSDNEGAQCQYPTSSCYDDYNYDYDDRDELVASGGGTGSASAAPSEETSTLGLDHDDDEDEDERVGSWSISHNQADYSYSSSQQQGSSSVASSESENTASSLSTTASNPSVISGGCGRGFPPLATCHSIWDGKNNVCKIKDCSQLATKKCSQCKEAFYCCEEHQRFDWKRHKNECIPYRMESRFDDDVSVAVAARNIPQGQTIFSEKPLLVFALSDPDNDFLNVMDLPCIAHITNKRTSRRKAGLGFSCSAIKPSCFGCLKAVDRYSQMRYTCGTCKLPLCSYKCYLDAFHQATECQVVASQGGWAEDQHKCYHSLYMDIDILRALQLECRDISAWERFLELKQNLRVEAYKTSERYRRFMDHYKELVPLSAKMSGYHDDLIGNVHAIITALCFRPSLKSRYKLLFATQILFGHDCIPNTFHYLEESPTGRVNTMMLVTKASVPILKKEIITIDFCPTPFMYYPLRRMFLRNFLIIDNCSCKRCRNPSEMGDRTIDIKCPRCRDVICPENAPLWENSVWACKGCLEDFPYAMVKKVTQECRDELAIAVTQPKHTIIAALQQFIAIKENQALDPEHCIIIQAWSYIEAHLRSSLNAKRLPGPAPRYQESTIADYRMLKTCCEVIEKHLDVVRPGICFERGFMHLNRYYVELATSTRRFDLRLIKRKDYAKELMQCMKSLQEALKIFQMFEGCSRDVSTHIQEATSALVATKSYIQQQIRTDNEETKTNRASATAAAISSTSALFRDTL